MSSSLVHIVARKKAIGLNADGDPQDIASVGQAMARCLLGVPPWGSNRSVRKFMKSADMPSG